MEKSVFCVVCNKAVSVHKQGADSLTEHATLHNHIQYRITDRKTREHRNICCDFCKNQNIMILGYSTRVKKHACIRCITQMENFSSFLEWKDTYVSWYPFVLSYSMVTALESSPVEKVNESTIQPDLYPILMNREVLCKLSEIIAEKGGEELQTDYCILGYGDFATCVRVRIPQRETHSEIIQSCCCQVSFDGKPNKEDAVVIMCQKDEVVLIIRNMKPQSINQNGKCTIVFPTKNWIDVSFYSTAGFLLQDNVKQSILLSCWMGRDKKELYPRQNLFLLNGIHLKDVEKQHLTNSVKNVLDVIKCGNDPVRQIGKR